MSSTQSLEISDAQDSCVKEQNVAITDAPVSSAKISLVESDSVEIGTTTDQGESNSLACSMTTESENEAVNLQVVLGAAASPEKSIKASIGSPPGLRCTAASSSVTIQAAFDDSNKNGACDAGGAFEGSPNHGDGATSPTGSAGAGLAMDIGASGTPESVNVKRINFDCDSDNGLVQANEPTDSTGNVVHTGETV